MNRGHLISNINSTRHENPRWKRGHHRRTTRAMSSTVATVFLVMITIAAVAILWGVVFPFINNEVDLANYNVRLEIITDNGYTVYDPVDRFAMVQVKRTADEATLSGMEIFMDFDGQGYKTTLRAPEPGGLKRYVFNMSDLEPAEPGYTSVAPIFLERGREFVGTITSNLIMPQANINVNITELILELQTDDNNDTFLIVLDEDLTEVDYSGCQDGEREDPWGGCAFHSSVISAVLSDDPTIVNLNTWDSNIDDTNDYVKFSSGSDGCVASENSCIKITGENDPTITSTTGSILNIIPSCSDSVIYIYDNSGCS